MKKLEGKQRLHDVDHGNPGVRRLRRDQGSLAVVRPDVVGRDEQIEQFKAQVARGMAQV